MDVQVGQVWEDCDPRMMRGNILTSEPAHPRRFKIVWVFYGGHRVEVKDIDTGQVTRIATRRLRPGSRGYRLVTETRE